MIHIGLFEGIGGFGLAAHWAGWKTYATCEINPFGRRVLEHYWPGAYHHGDIKTLDYGTIDVELSKRFGGKWRDDEIIVTGGFPCQPFSVAGQRKGTEDDRHLWPEMLRAIREIQPSWIVGENVSGLINWSGGLVFEEVQTDLENEGYEVWANVLPAASVNAPHKRDRVWFVAYSDHNRKSGRTIEDESSCRKKRVQKRNKVQQPCKSNCLRELPTDSSSERCNHGSDNRQERQVYNNKNGNAQEDKPEWNGRKCRTCQVGKIGNVTNADGTRFQKTGSEQQATRFEQHGELGGTSMHTYCTSEQGKHFNRPGEREFNGPNSFKEINNWEKFPTQAPICDGDDGLSSRLDAITFPKWRTESVKGGGNAIVPQVAFQIFKAINEFRSSGA